MTAQTQIPWIDEKCFTRGSVFNIRKCHLSVRNNPHANRERGYQISFSMTVLAVINGDICMTSYMLPNRLIAHAYRELLETVLPGMLEGMFLTARLYCCFCTTELQQAMGNITGSGWKRKMQNGRLHGVLRRQKKTMVGLFIGQLGRGFTLSLLEIRKISRQDVEAAVTKVDVSVLRHTFQSTASALKCTKTCLSAYCNYEAPTVL